MLYIIITNLQGVKMYNSEKTLLDLQLDQACKELSKLIKLGRVLPDYNKIWKQFTKSSINKGSKK